MENYTKIIFVDFDNTLAQTPEPEEGKKIWKEKTGKSYPHTGWWGRTESLDLNVFDIELHPEIKKRINKDIEDENTFVVLLSSRLIKLRPRIIKILDKHDINVDLVSLKYGGNDKVDRVKKILKDFPNVKDLVFYDDRDKELDLFKQYRIDDANDHNIKIYKVIKGKPKEIKENLTEMVGRYVKEFLR